jgi:hypothetical protein
MEWSRKISTGASMVATEDKTAITAETTEEDPGRAMSLGLRNTQLLVVGYGGSGARK